MCDAEQKEPIKCTQVTEQQDPLRAVGSPAPAPHLLLE